MEKLRFRQIHLDFHTSPDIPGIGAKFDKKHWQENLKKAHVDSITCFSSCHHGWSYHPTKVGQMHPELSFNLLREQMDACKEINVNVPVYLTAGVNNVASDMHPEWREINSEGRYSGWSPNPLTPGFHKMCFNTPYLDYLCDMIREAAQMFPEADGIFTDIIHQGQCCCPWCMKSMAKGGFDAEKPEDREAHARKVLLNYYKKTTEAAKAHDSSMRMFHNSGHIQCGDTEILKYFSHLELESLPTGGWGYDHYPMSAAYTRKLDLDFLGMTGKFHTTWGEFGGFKHPNALRYECAAMLAQGSKCSIGDQLHPCGKLDESTYEIIGAAYSEVEAKEPWCDDVDSRAEVAILSNTAINKLEGRGAGESAGEVGACRMLLESHIHFDVLDTEMSFDGYKVIILADDIKLDDRMQNRLEQFMRNGGKLIMSGASGLNQDGAGFVFDLGAEHHGISEYDPDFILPEEDFLPDFVHTPFVMYLKSQRIKVTSGMSLGKVYDPYFNRSYKHFCSHQHTPYKLDDSGFDCGVINGSILYFAHPVFSIYRGYGIVALKEYVTKAVKAFIGKDMQIITNLPSQGRVTLFEQEAQSRYVMHLLYANTISRGGALNLSGGNARASYVLEVIEDMNPCCNVAASVKLPRKIKRITLEPQGVELPFEYDGDRVNITLDSFTCHQMLVMHY